MLKTEKPKGYRETGGAIPLKPEARALKQGFL